MALFAFRHYLYPYWPQAQWGDVYGMGGALCLLALLALVPLWWWLKAWAMGEELLTAGCTAAYLSWPQWFTHAFPDERCSQALGLRVSSIMLCVLSIVVWRVSTAHLCSIAGKTKGRK
jgi:hypothetical protein